MNYLSLADVRRYVKGVKDAEDIRVIGEIEGISSVINGVLRRRYGLPLLTAAAGGAVIGSTPPADGDTVTVGDKTYRWKDTMAAANDLKRGASATLCGVALVAGLSTDPLYSGTYYFATTTPNGYCTGVNAAGTVTLTARKGGLDGNGIPLSATGTALTLTAFAGGLGSYALLRMIGCDLVQAVLIRGHVTAAMENSTKAEAKQLWDAAYSRLLALVGEGGSMNGDIWLTDDTGTAAAASTGMQPTSTTADYVPEVGPEDPAYWNWDANREISR